MKMPVDTRLGFGVGLDLTWGSPIGFHSETGHISAQTYRFLERHRDWFNYAFLSFQPRDLGRLDANRYLPAYKEFFQQCRGERALHHTILNLGSLEPYDRSNIFVFTNTLVRELGIKWINEDLGIWSLRGHSLPYPLPPLMTVAGVDACVQNCVETTLCLEAPLVIEFPGFTDGNSFTMGSLDAFEVFREVADQSDVPVVLDVGHILSWLWITGKEGNSALAAIEDLPLERCFELHLSGSARIQGRFRDLHHGILLDEQISLTNELLKVCDNLKAITYEDPRFDPHGALIPPSLPNVLRLRELVELWCH